MTGKFCLVIALALLVTTLAHDYTYHGEIGVSVRLGVLAVIAIGCVVIAWAQSHPAWYLAMKWALWRQRRTRRQE